MSPNAREAFRARTGQTRRRRKAKRTPKGNAEAIGAGDAGHSEDRDAGYAHVDAGSASSDHDDASKDTNPHADPSAGGDHDDVLGETNPLIDLSAAEMDHLIDDFTSESPAPGDAAPSNECVASEELREGSSQRAGRD